MCYMHVSVAIILYNKVISMFFPDRVNRLRKLIYPKKELGTTLIKCLEITPQERQIKIPTGQRRTQSFSGFLFALLTVARRN